MNENKFDVILYSFFPPFLVCFSLQDTPEKKHLSLFVEVIVPSENLMDYDNEFMDHIHSMVVFCLVLMLFLSSSTNDYDNQ